MAWEFANIIIMKPEGYIHSECFKEVAETMAFAFDRLGIKNDITWNRYRDDAENIILGWHLMAEDSPMPEGAILYNLEQLGDANAHLRDRLVGYAKRYRLWDYSQKNIDILKGVDPDISVRLVPIGTMPEMNRIKPMPVQDIDILFYGCDSPHRKAVLDVLRVAGLNVVSVYGVYGEGRDTLIARAKIVLNMHFYDANIMEMVRLSYLLTNGKCVVSECNQGTEIPDWLDDAVALAPYEWIVPACIDLIQNPTARKRLEVRGRDHMLQENEADILRDVLGAYGHHIPQVSVIVPTRDRLDLLVRALGSIRDQTYQNFEVIVMNDGGCPIPIPSNGKWRIYNLPAHLGASVARNEAIHYARGRWIAYLDDDDMWYSDHLEVLVDTMLAGHQVAYTDSDTFIEDESGEVQERVPVQTLDFTQDRILERNITPINNVMHERACLDVVGMFDQELEVLEDWDLWIRMSRKWEFAHVVRTTAEVRWRGPQSNATFAKRDLFPVCRERISAKVRMMLEAEHGLR